jgi:hypothetical protein
LFRKGNKKLPMQTSSAMIICVFDILIFCPNLNISVKKLIELNLHQYITTSVNFSYIVFYVFKFLKVPNVLPAQTSSAMIICVSDNVSIFSQISVSSLKRESSLFNQHIITFLSFLSWVLVAFHHRFEKNN